MKALTHKQAYFVKKLANNPKMKASQVVEEVYNPSNKNVASAMASELLAKPQIKMALQEHVNKSEDAIVSTIEDWGHSENTRRREIATQNAQYLHDKVFGKATTRVEMNSQTVSINIDLSGGTAGTPPPELFLDDQQ